MKLTVLQLKQLLNKQDDDSVVALDINGWKFLANSVSKDGDYTSIAVEIFSDEDSQIELITNWRGSPKAIPF